MVRKLSILVFILHLLAFSVSAQTGDDSAKGLFSGEWRTFYLHTFNKKELKDFYALGTGGYLGYTYTWNSRWKAGVNIYSAWNTSIQDLSVPDPVSGRLSRYELGLFDVTDPGNRLIVLPGELYLSYTGGAHTVTAGRMKRSTPLVNPQDGRMIPTLVEGLWYAFQPDDRIDLQAGLLTRIAPRGTDQFSGIGSSIGKFSSGLDITGRPSGYAGNTSSDFLLITGGRVRASSATSVHLWNYYVDNVFNSTYIRPEFTLSETGVVLGLEWIHQRRVNNGGNAIDTLSYFQDQYANLIGAQITIPATENHTIILAYDHITDDGRFLFPREWGREGTFTFQKRERTEGSRQNHAMVVSFASVFAGEYASLNSVLSIGHQWKPAPSDAQRNKYALPEYTQINLDLTGRFAGIRNLKPEILLTYKIGHDEFPENPAYILNKVDMFQINVVLNYQF